MNKTNTFQKKLNEVRKKFLEGIGVPEPTEFKADPFQLRAVDSVMSGSDTLVVAPTGTGKTFIAVEGIKKTLAKGEKAIYTTPLKALSNTKYAEFKALFEPEYSVGLLTGDRKIDGDSQVVVATTEIYRNDLYNYGGIYSLVILDEFHYVSDPQRGPVWEESIILSPKTANLLMLSASISNHAEIAQWISEVRDKNVNVVRETERKVPLKLGFLNPKLGVVPLEDEKSKELEVHSYVKDFYTNFKKDYGNKGRRYGKGRGSDKGRSDNRGPRKNSPGKNSSTKKRGPKS